MVAPEVAAAFAAAFGLAVGSFLNVLISRAPAGKSLLCPPSACLSCGRRLRPLELIPVFSFLALGGRCAGCRAPIGWRYPAVEAATGVAAAGVAAAAGPLAAAAALLATTLLVWAWAAGRQRGRAEQGSLLMEVALACALFLVVVVSLLNLFSYSLAETNEAGQRVAALNLARAKLEIMRQQPVPLGSSGPVDGFTWTAAASKTFPDPDGLTDAQGNPIQLWVLTVKVEYDRGSKPDYRTAVALAGLRGDQP